MIPDTDTPLSEARRQLQRGQHLKALTSLDRLVASNPASTGAWLIRGEALLALGRHDEAISSLDKCVSIDQNNVDAHLLRAAVEQAIGRTAEALEGYARVLSLHPGNADAHNNIGLILAARREFDGALAEFDAALRTRPDSVEAINHRGMVLKETGSLQEALGCFDRALALRPGMLPAMYNRAEVLGSLKRNAEALDQYEQALVHFPDDPHLHNNRGATLLALGRYAEALAAFDRAIELLPDYADALDNRGTALEAFDELEQAEASIRAAIRVEPLKVSAHWNLSLCLLRMGRFEEGWKLHEWRWRKEVFRRFDFGLRQPRWDGSQALAGKSILLTAEQGLGDTLQFVRYAALLEAKGARVLLFAQSALVELVAHSMPNVRVFNQLGNIPAFDFQCPLLSLPLAFGTRLDTVPAAVPYLRAPLRRRVAWEHKLPPSGRARIGLVWAGSTSHANDANRSMTVRDMLPLLDVDSCEFVVLQKEISAEERLLLEGRSNVRIVGDGFADFADTAAVVSQLELVISVDTSVAHLAGAMGKPVWILLPIMADWRWMLQRHDSPWYPTARLYRRANTDMWPAVIARVSEDLRGFGTSLPAHSESIVTSPHDALHAAAAMHNAGNLSDAIAIYEGVLKLDPNDFDANHLLGIARRAQGRFAEAESLVRNAVRLRPGNVAAHKSLARVLGAAGKQDEVATVQDHLTELAPKDSDVWSERAVLRLAQGKHEEALEDIDHALALQPTHVNALNNRGVALIHLGRHAEALDSLDALLELKPESADALSNRGLALLGLLQPREAVANYRHGLDLHPDSTTLLSNLGISLMAVNLHAEGIECFRRVIEVSPDHLDANWNLALSLLVTGDFENGWPQYEWRWKRVEMAPHLRQFLVPLWTGAEEIAGRRILLHFEQGFGDTFQFLRYIRPLAARGAVVLLVVPDHVRRLAQASFPEVPMFGIGEPLPSFDLHCPLLSLPRAFGTTLETIPCSNESYLRAPPENLEVWRRRFKPTANLRVGLVWSGNPSHKHDRTRSFSLETLRPLLDLPGAEYYGLQKDVRPHDAECIASLPALKMLGGEFADFSDTAATIAQLDLVISVDTSVAHLAGAIGKPVWILLPYSADWRWLTGRESSPWYPSARLFRARETEEPDKLVGQVRTALASMIKARRK